MLLRVRILGWLLLLLCAAPVAAEVELAGVFGDGMVLQRGAKVPLWGRAEPGETVRVEFAGQQVSTSAASDGRWMVWLEPMEALVDRELTVIGSNTLTRQRVCVGEVWICSGQSNMAWQVRAAKDAEQEVAAANDRWLRLFSVPHKVANEPLTDVAGAWHGTDPKSVANFSAVAYFFGRQLRMRLDVPVGLIHTSWGGTPAEAWTSMETLSALQEMKPTLQRWEQHLAQWPELKQRYDVEFKKWQKAAQRAKREKQQPPRRPRPPLGPDSPHIPAGLYNGMIAPLLPYGIRGAIWYQGESNAGRADQYRTLFPAMITDWRQRFHQGEFPFLFVQLANFKKRADTPGESDWAELREAQRLTLRLPATGMAVTIDIGEANDIHPKNKQEVGRRLSLWALHSAYGRTGTPHSGPLPVEAKRHGRKFRVTFEHVGEGLGTADGLMLRGFAIAGKDKRWHWALAEAKGDQVEVWHPDVRKPVAVRYGWADNPDCNLVNSAGLPASTFRTDDWPWTTAGKG